MISRALKCVFVHIPKVAGQSIEEAFLQYHGLTWETRAPLLLRKRNNPAEGPGRLAHLTAREYVDCGHLTPEEWEAYFTFSFVRNPWARAVSMYRYYGDHRRMPFDRFVRDRLAGTYWRKRYWFVRPQADFICDEEDNVLVDYVGRMENIREDFATVCSRIGLHGVTLPHRNQSSTPPWSRKHWHGIRNGMSYVLGALRQQRYSRGALAAYYDGETAALVERLYKRDVALFGYRFEDLPPPNGEAGIQAQPPLTPRRTQTA
jgi:hypothetical protein